MSHPSDSLSSKSLFSNDRLRSRPKRRSSASNTGARRGSSVAKPKQLELLKAPPRHFGGRLLLGRRKSLRPLASREAIHLVMRSLYAKGEHSFRHSRHRSSIERILINTAKKYGVKLYRKSINSNHIHLVLGSPNREQYKSFVRVITGLIATQVMQGLSFEEFRRNLSAKNSSALAAVEPQPTEPQGKGQKFFQFRPFTRVLHWGRDFRTCCQYVVQNTLEAVGFIIYKARKDHYARWIRESLDDSPLITS